jgi:hypothetical protein
VAFVELSGRARGESGGHCGDRRSGALILILILILLLRNQRRGEVIAQGRPGV